MLVGLCGGICAGKHSIASYLVQHQGFSTLYLKRSIPAQPDGSVQPQTKTKTRTPQQCRSETNSGYQDESFETVDSLLDFVTKNWQRRWVTLDIHDEEVLEKLIRRPFFILVSVDAPVTLRWKRFTERCDNEEEVPTFENFVLQNDHHLYNATFGLAWLVDRAEIRLINQTSSLEKLYRALKNLDIANNERLRPNWDQYFMQLASLAAQRSNCMKRRVGCVLVRENRVISTGYNGTPRNLQNCNEGGCARCNAGHGAGAQLSTCLCIHAEENALLEAGRERIREGSTLYCDTCPCLTCSIKVIQVGISEVVYSQSYAMDRETAAVFLEGGVKLRQFFPPRRGLVCLE